MSIYTLPIYMLTKLLQPGISFDLTTVVDVDLYGTCADKRILPWYIIEDTPLVDG